MTPTLSHLSALLRDTAAAEILPRLQGTEAHHKSDGSLVTQSDLAVQARLTETLARDFPGIPLLGEEMSETEQQRILADNGRGVWVLDPVDGTSNFVSGFPGFAISLALVEDGRVTLGAVLDPVRDECFTAARGVGAFLDGEPIHTQARSAQLKDCLAMIDMKRLPPEVLPALFRPGGFGSQRNLGAVALDWCWLAQGRVQLYLHGGQRLWDYAAGRLIAEEAGAAALHYSTWGAQPSQALGLESRRAIAAANPHLLDVWLDFLRPLWDDASD